MSMTDAVKALIVLLNAGETVTVQVDGQPFPMTSGKLQQGEEVAEFQTSNGTLLQVRVSAIGVIERRPANA